MYRVSEFLSTKHSVFLQKDKVKYIKHFRTLHSFFTADNNYDIYNYNQLADPSSTHPLRVLFNYYTAKHLYLLNAVQQNNKLLLVAEIEGSLEDYPRHKFSIGEYDKSYSYLKEIQNNQFYLATSEFWKTVFTPKFLLRFENEKIEVVEIPELKQTEITTYKDFEFSYAIEEAACICLYDLNNNVFSKIDLFDRIKDDYQTLSQIDGFTDLYYKPKSLKEFSERTYKISNLSSFKYKVSIDITERVRRYDRTEITFTGIFDLCDNQWQDIKGSMVYVDNN